MEGTVRYVSIAITHRINVGTTSYDVVPMLNRLLNGRLARVQSSRHGFSPFFRAVSQTAWKSSSLGAH